MGVVAACEFVEEVAMMHTGVRVELWSVPDCPLVGHVRTALAQCLRQAGIVTTVRERQGDYPSPTLLVDGIDVATGSAPGSGTCCRLDLPTNEQILAALRQAAS